MKFALIVASLATISTIAEGSIISEQNSHYMVDESKLFVIKIKLNSQLILQKQVINFSDENQENQQFQQITSI